MRNRHRKLPCLTLICVGTLCANLAYGAELEGTESVTNLCRFSEPATNPFAVEQPAGSPAGVEAAPRAADGEVVDEVHLAGTRTQSEVAPELVLEPPVPQERGLDEQGDEGDATADGSQVSVAEAYDALRYSRERRDRLTTSYEVVADASQFQVGSYDAATETVVVMLAGPVSLAGSTATVRFPDDNMLTFAAEPETAERLETQWRAGAVEMWLRFNLASREQPAVPYCDQNTSGGPEVVGHLVEAAVVEPVRGTRIVRMGTERVVHERCAREARARNDEDEHEAPEHVRIASIESMGERSMSEAEASMLALFTELSLGECYFEAQIGNAALEGAIVLQFELGERGEFREVRMPIDALRSETFRQCATEVFAASRIPRERTASELETRMTVIFTD